jgi:hypothetical protein
MIRLLPALGLLFFMVVVIEAPGANLVLLEYFLVMIQVMSLLNLTDPLRVFSGKFRRAELHALDAG